MKKDSLDSVYTDISGRTLSRQHGESFSWILKDCNDLIIHQYLCNPQSILASAFELSHEALWLMRGCPDLYSIISVSIANELLVISGRDLDSLIKSGELKVFPSSYRLVPQ
jgi:hypothetical protein